MAPIRDKIKFTAPPPVNRGITCPRLKAGLFAIEGLNAAATTSFFYYVYFYMRENFGFNAFHNFMLAAVLGLIYTVMSVLSGRFAQKFGYLVSLRWGIVGMGASFALETQAAGLTATVALMVTGTIGMCFTWPALEALVSEGEPRKRLQSLLGAYNVIWAAASALAYFVGGALIKKWGWNAMFLFPASLEVLELLIVLWIQSRVNTQPARPSVAPAQSHCEDPQALRSPVSPPTFLKMAWLANPLAYLAINTLVSVIPSLGAKLNLDTMTTGFVCSIWLFVRAAAFVVLWVWPGWHYRFRFLAASYVGLVAGFTLMLTTPVLWLLVAAQVCFGIAVGLIYYSSLFYSMDVGETKGEHGGIHEGAIGAGCFAGPATAACGLYFFPLSPSSGAVAVTLLLLSGLGGLYWLRYKD